jgi:glutathione S-transferase
MNPLLELFVLSWGVYPRRVLIYLAEKNLLKSPLIRITEVTVDNGKLSAPGKPSGTAPVLRLPDGTFIKQSIAILEYFEDICQHPEESWQVELAKEANGSMLGNTAKEKGRVRDMLSLADEITSQFGFACHKGTALFKQLEETHPTTAKLILEYCYKNLGLLDRYYEERSGFDASDSQVNMADCVLYSVVHFAKELYSLDLLADSELSNLRAFYEWFGKRESVQVDGDHFPGWIKELASQWLPAE